VKDLSEELKDIYKYIDKHFDEYVKETRKYLGVLGGPIIGYGTEESANMTLKYLEDIGAEDAQLYQSKKMVAPVVYGKLKSKNPKAKTVLLYSHYDVTVYDEKEWTVPPSSAEIVDAERIKLPPELGKVIVARGAHDKKAPVLGFILSLKAIREVRGDVPVNVIFALEGEEEIMSPNFKDFVDRFMNELKRADCAYSFGSYRQLPSGLLIIHPGYKGLTELELSVRGGDWGGRIDGKDLWSGMVAFADQPLARLVNAIGTMVDKNGRVLIEGFYDKYRPPTPEEKRDLEKVRKYFDEKSWLADLNIKRFRDVGKPPVELFIDYIVGTQVALTGLQSGTGDTLPQKAKAQLHFRFGPNYRRTDFLEFVKKHLAKNGFPEIEVNQIRGNDWSRSTIDQGIGPAVVKTAKLFGVEYVIWPTSPATDAFYLLNQEPLKLAECCGSLGKGGRFHLADEYVTVEGIRDNIKGFVTTLFEYAKL
jgi:acetylornithine deacetylase/succinyl-diaminopimelate desuccinylase-like protein